MKKIVLFLPFLYVLSLSSQAKPAFAMIQDHLESALVHKQPIDQEAIIKLLKQDVASNTYEHSAVAALITDYQKKVAVPAGYKPCIKKWQRVHDALAAFQSKVHSIGLLLAAGAICASINAQSQEMAQTINQRCALAFWCLMGGSTGAQWLQDTLAQTIKHAGIRTHNAKVLNELKVLISQDAL